MTIPTPDTRTGSDPAALSSAIRSAVGRVYRRFRSERTPGELGDAAMSVLHRLRRFGPQSLTALSGHFRVTPGSMSQTVNRLTADSYAIRSADPADGRKVMFQATQKGVEASTASLAGSVSWLDTQVESLTDSDRALLARAVVLLRKIADS